MKKIHTYCLHVYFQQQEVQNFKREQFIDAQKDADLFTELERELYQNWDKFGPYSISWRFSYCNLSCTSVPILWHYIDPGPDPGTD